MANRGGQSMRSDLRRRSVLVISTTLAMLGVLAPATWATNAIDEFSGGLTATNVPTSLVVGSDGNLWFTDPGTYKSTAAIGRITPSGTITEYPVGLEPSDYEAPTRCIRWSRDATGTWGSWPMARRG